MDKLKSIKASYRKIITISILFVIILGISVIAGNVKVNSITIRFANNHEITVLTSKTKVSEILEDNHIMLSSDEKVIPSLDEEVTEEKTIIITNSEAQITKIAEVSEEELENDIEQIAQEYSNIIDEIITVKEEIPFETITKDVSNGGDTTNRVLQAGKNGLREVTYKVRSKDGIEVERIELYSKIIKEPVNKIVQIQTKAVTSRSGGSRTTISGSAGEYQAYAAERCAAYGWSQNDFDCLVKLWNKESGWNPNAYNSYSGAYGIPQALPGSKMASAGADYQTNYQTQINWGLGYIKSRYGTPSNAWYHSQTTGWY